MVLFKSFSDVYIFNKWDNYSFIVQVVNINISSINCFNWSTNKVTWRIWKYFQTNFVLGFQREFFNQEFMRHHNMILFTEWYNRRDLEYDCSL